MAVVCLPPLLVTGGVQRRAVGDDDIVAAVGGGVPDGLVLAHEDHGDTGGETAERRGGDGFRGGLDG